MSALISFLSSFGFGGSASGKPPYIDDDAIDRLSRKATLILLSLSMILVSTKQYVGDPIQCWVPGHFPKQYYDYVNKLCWVSDTYYLPHSEPIPLSTPDNKLINYYQWVPMLLLFHAATFYIPCVAWKTLSKTSGISLHDLLETSKLLRECEKRTKVLDYIIHMIHHFLKYYQLEQNQCCISFMRVIKKCLRCRLHGGNYLSIVYIAIKILYLTNAVGHLFLLSTYLGTDFHIFGAKVLYAFIKQSTSPTVFVFPRETFCDFKIRTQGSTHRYSVQCVLPINFFNEKIYVCFWFWLIFVIAATLVSIFIWLVKIFYTRNHVKIVKKYLRCSQRLVDTDISNEDVRKFVKNYLKQDGVFLLRFLAFNISDLDMTDLTAGLWKKYQADLISSPI